MRWGLTRDLWLAVRPDIGSLEKPIREADAKFADSPGDVQALIVAALAERYRRRPAAGRLPRDRLAARGVDLDRRRRSRCSAPCGGLAVARGAARRVRSLYSARVGRELSRA